MSLQERTNDRREAVRFEIVGRLKGTLAIIETLRVENLSLGGALLTAVRPLDRDTIHTLQLESNTHVATLQARVARVTHIEHDKAFAVALEFLDPEPSAHDSIEAMMKARAADRV